VCVIPKDGNSTPGRNSIYRGITDLNLQDQARIQRFSTTASLLEAFKKIALRSRDQQDSIAATRSNRGIKQSRGDEREWNRPTRCYCGMQNHWSADCPSRERGVKCFHCGERRHIAARCTKGKNAVRDSYAVSEQGDEKYYKNVYVDDKCIVAVIDTGSDMCLMRVDCYVRLGAPRLKENKVCFHGIGSAGNETLGEFDTNVIIDGDAYRMKVRVISDTLMRHDLIIGADFLRIVEVAMKEGEILISKSKENPKVPEIFQIDCMNGKDGPDSAHLDDGCRIALENMIEKYKPDKTRDVNVNMSLILKDDELVYQRVRRLSEQEKKIVRQQVNEWLSDGIVQPSLSEHASPVVLVRKKDGAYRLVYRRLNRKIVKDRYPLPLIDDQLDRLQSAKIFTTLDLKNRFFYVKVDENSRKFTAFIIPDGQYEFLRMPFGLCNSPAIFQRYINAVFRDLVNDGVVLTYMDDLIIPSGNYGLQRLNRVLDTASQFGLMINWEKCNFLKLK